MNYDHWINRKKIHEHLDWNSRLEELSSFISVFDNQDDALARVKVHQKRVRQGIFVAQIDTQSLRPILLSITFRGGTEDLPAWEGYDSVKFLLTRDMGQYLGVNVAVSQQFEWFALNHIPAGIITRIDNHE
ncbi:hypothetical protein OCU04_005525 [Sclerotinia nivalis]|uniref:DUF7587 domain-containing protein n=1 Tax=Sclerotinia nivalis TaxID=352851 RepID=A0A9X0DLA0_9HELO|nr:hypothetical protein OCU04_005525 [Sclerotinia nivalis]